jgi:hypothetical protein
LSTINKQERNTNKPTGKKKEAISIRVKEKRKKQKLPHGENKLQHGDQEFITL